MQIEPLPKVTFLPKQLTELVIENWTGDIIDYEKNGQVSSTLYYQIHLLMTLLSDLSRISRIRHLSIQRWS